jgi:hypothetical protein
MYVFAAGQTILIVNGKPTTPVNLYMIAPSWSVRAKNFGPILFMGGPPNRLSQYAGSLQTVLEDYILTAWINNDTKTLQKLEQ